MRHKMLSFLGYFIYSKNPGAFKNSPIANNLPNLFTLVNSNTLAGKLLHALASIIHLDKEDLEI
jgi:hypothetical protein